MFVILILICNNKMIYNVRSSPCETFLNEVRTHITSNDYHVLVICKTLYYLPTGLYSSDNKAKPHSVA